MDDLLARLEEDGEYGSPEEMERAVQATALLNIARSLLPDSGAGSVGHDISNLKVRLIRTYGFKLAGAARKEAATFRRKLGLAENRRT